MTITNLRHHRKQHKRQLKEKQAAENRHKFGLTKSEKKLTEIQNKMAQKRLQQHQVFNKVLTQ